MDDHNVEWCTQFPVRSLLAFSVLPVLLVIFDTHFAVRSRVLLCAAGSDMEAASPYALRHGRPSYFKRLA